MLMRITIPTICLVILSMPSAWGETSPARSGDSPRIMALLHEHCIDCHGGDEQQADLRFDQLDGRDPTDPQTARIWLRAVAALESGEMPPPDAASLSNADRGFLTRGMERIAESLIAGFESPAGRSVLRRLNRDEYQNTMSELLHVDMDFARDIPSDSPSPAGFRNDGQALLMSPLLLEAYLDSARRGLARAIVTGPPPRVFRHQFNESNFSRWPGLSETSNRLERAQVFLVRMVDDYPEQGEFRIRVQARASLREGKGFPILEVSLGYQPDTQIDMRRVGSREVTSSEVQQFEFRGRIENFPLPVRGQGKFPGLVVRLRNIYDDGTPPPNKLKKVEIDGKPMQVFDREPALPQLIIESIEFVSPVYAEWPPASHRELLFDAKHARLERSQYVRAILEQFYGTGLSPSSLPGSS